MSPPIPDLLASGPATPQDLRQLHMFEGVCDDVLDEVFPQMRRTRHRNRSTILLQLDFGGRVGFVWTGRFRFCATTPDGETVTLYELAPRDAFGYALASAGMRYGDVHRLFADKGGVILDMPSALFLDLTKRSQLFSDNVSRALVRLTLGYGARVYELACSNVRNRLQSELLRWAARMEDRSDRRVLEPSPTHAVLAALVGATREAVTRHLRAMEDEGLIETERSKITILSVEALRAADAAALGRRFFRTDKD